MKIRPDVLDVLADPRLVVDGDSIRIPWELGKPLYEATTKVLRAVGGNWDGRRKANARVVFPFDVTELVRQIVLSGEFVSGSDLGWFPTPPRVVEEILFLAGISEQYAGLTVLEPSAGTGCIAGPAATRGGIVDCVEIDERRAAVLQDSGYARLVLHGNFLTDVKPLDYATGFQRVVMNPPFDYALDHVNHAMGFMADDAVLVSVLPASVTWRTDRVYAEFRELVHHNGGELIPLPAESFKESGTTINTVLAVIPTGQDGCTIRNHSWHLAQPKQLHLFAA
ncbi:hypothetical protein [Nonomuraea sp. NPDC052265]|uniref:hypothetical protein n=1 Tax=Nonomuraea sp. NPDC052265 TaxID=3364374 RepID=UPI0037C97784